MGRLIDDAYDEAKENTPEDTYDLQNAWEKDSPTKKAGIVQGSIYNTQKHAPPVEF